MTFAGATTLSLSKPNNNLCTVNKGRKTPSEAHVSSAWWGEVAST